MLFFHILTNHPYDPNHPRKYRPHEHNEEDKIKGGVGRAKVPERQSKGARKEKKKDEKHGKI